MTFINDLLGNLFPEKKSNFNHKENFTQSGEAVDAIRNWMDSDEGKRTFDHLYKTYHLKKAGVNDQPEVHILSSPYANGFAITFEHPVTEEAFSNLFFAFGLRMLDLGYYRVSLDRKLQETEDLVKTTEKQYFKPPVGAAVRAAAQKMDQLFGNVSIEKVLIDGKPSLLKVLVTVYSDHLYGNAKPFDQFIEELFER
ncbi:MAG: hypothetical protein WD426_01280 [Anditalea sp.]